ncbi:MAG: DUF4349 domain-containing protein [Chloroflexi bacterium]|nr:DUF4349 domain-containing protein [Chloroflexota bacterium]
MKTRSAFIALVVSVFVLSGCAKAAALPPVYVDKTAPESALQSDMAASPSFEAPAPGVAPAPLNSTGIATTSFKQMIIMNADLTIAVDDPGVSMAAIQELASSMGGFVVSSNVYKTQTSTGIEVPEASITVRVPAAKLNDALARIKEMTGDASKYTINENISGQDVTQEYTDLSSRLRNLEEADAKLSELYDSAVKTEDALAIYNQKMLVTEQIEVIKGQMQYYEQSSAMSAITVQIVAKETIAPITVAGWQPQGVLRDAVQSLINFSKGLVEFLIWLIIFVVPVLLVIGLPIFFFIRWLVRRNRRLQSARLEAIRKGIADKQPPAR